MEFTILASSWDICIHFETWMVLHTLTKLRVPSKTVIGSSFKQDGFCKYFFLQFHSCLQLGCRDEYFEEENYRTIMFKKHPNPFHISGGMLPF
jgi:hypothetical protein